MTSSDEILVVEQDRGCRAFLASNLTEDGYTVIEAGTRGQALQLLAWRHPALVLVDVERETVGLLDAVRSGVGAAGRFDPSTPVIVLASRADELTRVRVFEHDGDDVVAKPFSYPELRGRIRALLRRAYGDGSREVIRVGVLTVNVGTREVQVGERGIAVSAKEFDLLHALASDPGRVFTKQELLRAVWANCSPARTRTLESTAFRLRKKLADGGAAGFVVAVWGVGYCLYRDSTVPHEAAHV